LIDDGSLIKEKFVISRLPRSETARLTGLFFLIKLFSELRGERGDADGKGLVESRRAKAGRRSKSAEQARLKQQQPTRDEHEQNQSDISAFKLIFLISHLKTPRCKISLPVCNRGKETRRGSLFGTIFVKKFPVSAEIRRKGGFRCVFT
jgi:hypothetical protein